jgi:hypothetical protein
MKIVLRSIEKVPGLQIRVTDYEVEIDGSQVPSYMVSKLRQNQAILASGELLQIDDLEITDPSKG